ncbi:MAG: AzlC family ABC transporter permease [Oscillospiraceae bacterium]
MSCALSQKLSPDTPLGVRMLIGFDVTDEVFGIAIAQEGLLNVWYFIGAMCAAIPGWSLGTLFGALAGNVLPVWAMNGFSVMLYGMFLAIIMPEGKKNRVVLGCIGVSFVLSGLAAEASSDAQRRHAYPASDDFHFRRRGHFVPARKPGG